MSAPSRNDPDYWRASDLVAEQDFNEAMELAEKKEWGALATYLKHTDEITVEAVKENLNANDYYELAKVL